MPVWVRFPAAVSFTRPGAEILPSSVRLPLAFSVKRPFVVTSFTVPIALAWSSRISPSSEVTVRAPAEMATVWLIPPVSEVSESRPGVLTVPSLIEFAERKRMSPVVDTSSMLLKGLVLLAAPRVIAPSACAIRLSPVSVPPCCRIAPLFE